MNCPDCNIGLGIKILRKISPDIECNNESLGDEEYLFCSNCNWEMKNDGLIIKYLNKSKEV